MSNSRILKTLRAVLKTGSLVFGFSALALVVFPAIFISLLGLYSTPELEWSMRMIGVTLVALSGNMYSVSTFGTDKAVVFSGALDVVLCCWAWIADSHDSRKLQLVHHRLRNGWLWL